MAVNVFDGGRGGLETGARLSRGFSTRGRGGTGMLGSGVVSPTRPERPGEAVPDLVAHRGWAARYPENTLLAVEAAIGAGARYVEVDVQISSDGRPVLFHDRTLPRMCGASGAIHERKLAELLALSCAERGRFGDRFEAVRIAELGGFVKLLGRHPEVFAFVEIKRLAIERFGAADVLDRVLPELGPIRSRAALISFSLPFLAEARAKTSLPIGAVFDRFDEREAPEARALAAEFVFCDVDGLPKSGALDAGGARLAVYEVADPKLARALAARGVDLVETFAIGEMVEALGATKAGGA
jgi:glycerophosphoryl diester phosphodiesterase